MKDQYMRWNEGGNYKTRIYIHIYVYKCDTKIKHLRLLTTVQIFVHNNNKITVK